MLDLSRTAPEGPFRRRFSVGLDRMKNTDRRELAHMIKIPQGTLRLEKTVVLGTETGVNSITLSVRPYVREQLRCPVCGARCAPYDSRPRPRRWRAPDFWGAMCYLEYAACRAGCPEHGVHVEAVPWARPSSRLARAFEDEVAWTGVHCTISTTAEYMRVEWRTAGEICRRVYGDLEAGRGRDRFEGVRRIGIDETSHGKGQKRPAVVVDHDRGCLIWAHPDTGRDVLNLFFDELTPEQRAGIEVAAADGARWIEGLVGERCPNARQATGPFHVVSRTDDALDEAGRGEWRDAHEAYKAALPGRRAEPGRPRRGEEAPEEEKERLAGLKEAADSIKGMRFALPEGAERVTEEQGERLERPRRAGTRLGRAYVLKEELRAVLEAGDAEEAATLLDGWLDRACRCRIEEVVEVSRKVRRRRDDIVAAVAIGPANGRVEAINNKIKVTVRMGYGFRNLDNLVALLMLRCSDVKPVLPGRDPGEKGTRGRAAA